MSDLLDDMEAIAGLTVFGGPSPQVVGAVDDDLPVPGTPYTLGDLQAARAAVDRQAPAAPDARGRPLLRLRPLQT